MDAKTGLCPPKHPTIPKTPRSVYCALTAKCNLRCLWCYHFGTPTDVKEELSTQEWLTFFEELNRNAVLEVTLSGGEVLMRKDIRELIDGVVRNRMRFSILTNGTLIDDDFASFLNIHRKRCNLIQVSVDGASCGTHDAVRGEGSLEKVLHGIDLLKEYNLPVTARVTISKINLDEIRQTVSMLLDEKSLATISTNSAQNMGLCAQHSDSVCLNKEERFRAMEIGTELMTRYPKRIDSLSGPFAESDHLLNVAKMRTQNIMGTGGYLKSCGKVYYDICVRADGVMVPCVLLSHIKLGKINQDPIKEIWTTHPELIRLRNRRFSPLSEFKFCEGCDLISYCSGGCPAMAYTEIGTDFHPDPQACIRRLLDTTQKKGG